MDEGGGWGLGLWVRATGLRVPSTTLKTLLRLFLNLNIILLVSNVNVIRGDPLLCHPSCHCLDTFFDCAGKSLKTFPSDFPYWIKSLNVSNNEIVSIEPSHLSLLTHLDLLSADGNNLTEIPSSSAILKSLTHLSVSRNNIKTLDSSLLSPFPELKKLDVSKNGIEFLDKFSFPSENKIETLNLASNNIEILSTGSFDPLFSVTELILAKNRVKSISKDAFVRLSHLEKLDLSRNKLEVMDSLRFQELKKLQVLNLRRNHMSNLSDAAFYGLERVQQLYLDGNNIRVVDKRWLYGLRSLKTLNLSHNQVNHLEDDAWEFMEQLQILDLNFNQINGISKKSLFGLFKLRQLYLSHNQIEGIQEDAFISLNKIEVLDLSYNRLSWVLEDSVAPFRGLKESLTELNLAGNQIHTLHSDALLDLSNLKLLNLSSNPITWLSEKSFFPVPNAAILLSEVFTLVCDCESHWLYDRLVRTSFNNFNSNNRARHGAGRGIKKSTTLKPNTICAFPLELKGRNLVDLSLQDLSCSDKYRKPVFVEEPQTQILLMERSGTLTCHMKSYSNVSLDIQWRKDYHELSQEVQSRIISTTRAESDGTFHLVSKLQLVNVSWVDNGRYQCIGKGLGVVYSSKANVTVHVFPTFIKKPVNVTVRLGSNAKLECGAKGYPPPEIAFQKDGGEDFPAALERRFHVMPNDDSFFIMEVKLSDMGVYSCSAKNSAGEIRANATVTVFETPSFISAIEDESAVEGSNAILECLASGSPKPQIIWNKEGIPITEAIDKRYHLTENGSLLLIKDVRPDDAGRYECLLTNAIGTTRGFLTLTILPASAGKSLNLDNAAMTIIFIIVAVFCVVGTSAAWVVVIYRTRKRKKSNRGGPGICESVPLRQKYEDFEGPTASFTPVPSFPLSKVVCADSGSQSSSGKDSGNGEDIPDSITGIPDDEDFSSKGWRSRKDIETFSTFGTRASSSTRLSHVRLDLNSDCDNSTISLSNRSIPRRIPIPVPPPHVCLHVDTTSCNTKTTNYPPICSNSSVGSSIAKTSVKSEDTKKEVETEDNLPGSYSKVSTSFSTPV